MREHNIKFRKQSKEVQKEIVWQALQEDYLYHITSCSDKKIDKYGKEVIYCFGLLEDEIPIKQFGIKVPYYLADVITKHINHYGYINISFVKMKLNKNDKYKHNTLGECEWHIMTVLA